jgi:hypothetical protein
MLEEKNPYEVKLVDLGNKPEWSVSFPPSILQPARGVSPVVLYFQTYDKLTLVDLEHGSRQQNSFLAISLFSLESVLWMIFSGFIGCCRFP